jgi:hypothetical protein
MYTNGREERRNVERCLACEAEAVGTPLGAFRQRPNVRTAHWDFGPGNFAVTYFGVNADGLRPQSASQATERSTLPTERYTPCLGNNCVRCARIGTRGASKSKAMMNQVVGRAKFRL